MFYELALYFASLIAMAVLYFLPGFLISMFFKKYSLLEKVMMSFLFSTILIFLIGIAFHALNLLWSPYLLVPYMILTAVLLFVQRKQIRQIKLDKEIKLLFIIFFSVLIYKATIDIFIKMYPAGSDYINHYKTALFFLDSDWSLPEDYLRPTNYLPHRTPGFYMILGFFLSIFGKDFWVCQLATIVVNTISIFPTYCLAKTLFNKKIALITIIFLQMTAFIEISLYIFAKMFIAYFVIMALYLFVKKKGSVHMFGLLAGLSYLIHQVSLIFTAAIFVPYFISSLRKRNIKNAIGVIEIGIIALLVISPWLIINYLKYGTISTSDYINFPLYTNNYGDEKHYTTAELWENFKKTPIKDIIGARVVNFFTATTPAVLVLKVVSFIKPIIITTYKISNFATDIAWHRYFLDSLPGNLTALLFIFSMIGIFKLYRYNKTVFYFIVIPFIFFVLQIGWITIALVKSGVSPSIPIFVMVGFWEASKKKNANKWFKLIFILALIEFAIFWVSYSKDIAFAEEIARTGGANLSTKPTHAVLIEEYNRLFSAYKLFGLSND